MFTEDDLLPISALQHLLFCERQAALIHIERLWADNRLTVEGRHLHKKTHGGDVGPRGGGVEQTRRGPHGERIRIARGLPLRSLALGLFGIADVVEFHERPGQHDGEGITAGSGRQREPPAVFPIEYKRGRPKRGDHDRVQLCAQALCLEEMLGAAVPTGALFYGRTRRREDVVLDEGLRQTTRRAAARLHELVADGRTPAARREKKCRNCSLVNLCIPAAAERSALRYIDRVLTSTSPSIDDIDKPPGGQPREVCS